MRKHISLWFYILLHGGRADLSIKSHIGGAQPLNYQDKLQAIEHDKIEENLPVRRIWDEIKHYAIATATMVYFTETYIHTFI